MALAALPVPTFGPEIPTWLKPYPLNTCNASLTVRSLRVLVPPDYSYPHGTSQGLDQSSGEWSSGGWPNRHRSTKLMGNARSGHHRRSLANLIELMTLLHEREIGFKSLTEQIDTTTPGG